MHFGISGRVFRSVGPMTAPVRVVHDAVAGAVYSAVGTALSVGSRVAGSALANRAQEQRPLDQLAAGRVALSVLNGWHGDLLEQDVAQLALPMSVRVAGRDIPAEPGAVNASYPDATGRIAVFLHGLTENEGAWTYKSVQHYGQPGVSYGSQLRRDFGYTPVWLRYNTGLRVSVNGRKLDRLVEELVAAWPVPVDDLLLVGHSMGGLVVRSALAQAVDRGAEEAGWSSLVRDTISLGTPHLGAPLEQGTALLTHALGLLGETRPIAAVLAARSAGIKDLRHGNLLQADWVSHHPDALGNHRTHVPLHSGARHFILLGTIGRQPDSLVADLLGDLLVRPSSASGDTGDARRMALPDGNIHRLTGLHHFDLLNHPRVYQQIHRWLTDPPATQPARRA
jgi:alpha-beta hydrolase superfamily lysophospholipase